MSKTTKWWEQTILISSWKEKGIIETILKDLKLETLIPKFASEKIEPENVYELSDEELSHLGLIVICNYHCPHDLSAKAEEGVTMVVIENFLREGLKPWVC